MSKLTLAISDIEHGGIVETLHVDPYFAARIESFAMALPEFFAREAVSWAQMTFERLGCAEGREGAFEAVVLVSHDATYVGHRLGEHSHHALVAIATSDHGMGHVMAEVRRVLGQRRGAP